MAPASSGRTTRALAALGAAFLTFATVSLGKLLVALKHKSNFAAAILAAPPRDAFEDKVFWITGASSGIGRALALHLCTSHDNAKLILSSRRQEVLEYVAADCKNRGTGADARVLTLDLADHTSLPSKAEEALALYGGRIDILVNNGGIGTRSMAREAGLDVDKFVADVDFLSYVALTKALLPSWEGRGVGPAVINTSSVAGKIGVPVRTAYCAAKFAIQGWFDAFRLEQALVGRPADVLNVVLGSARTDIARNAVAGSPDRRFGESDGNIESGLDPEFVAERVLASAYAGRDEMWIAQRKELMLLYLNQYIPETARWIFAKKVGKSYAVQKGNQSSREKQNDKKDGEL